MPIAKNEIRRVSDALKYFQQRRRFAKAQQPGNIRESNLAFAPDSLDFLHLRKTVNHHSGDSFISRKIKRQIRSRNLSNHRQAVVQLQPLAQPKLNLRRLSRCNIPSVQF